MDEDIAIIDKNTRNEKIKNFILKNKKLLILSLTLIILFVIGIFAFGEFKEKKKNSDFRTI